MDIFRRPELPRTPHRHLKRPTEGRIETSDETTEFAFSCSKCGREEYCNFGVHGKAFIRTMIERAGWVVKGRGKNARATCEKCKG